jgi:MFS family permease
MLTLGLEAADNSRRWRSRVAIATLFFILGAGFGSWAVRIPDVQHRLHLSAGQLGSCLLAVAVGSMVGMPMADVIGRRLDSSRAAPMAAVAFALAVGMPAVAEGMRSLILALLMLGFGNGMLGVLINIQAVRLERHWGKPILTTFHAVCSGGGLVGSLSASVAAEARITPAVHLGVVAVILVILALMANPFLVPADTLPSTNRFPRFSVMALPLGFLTFCDLFCEGAVSDWSAVYLHTSVHVKTALTGIGYACFTVAMATGRMTGDPLSMRFGPRRLVLVAGALAFTGAAIALLSRTILPAATGFAILGLGLSVVFPRAISAAGRQGDAHAEPAVAAVSTIGYFGFLVGPPLVGYLAQTTSLSIGLGTLLQCCIGIMLLSRVLPQVEHHAVQPATQTEVSH